MDLKHYALSLLLLFALTVKGQEWHEFHVETPGTLQEIMGEGAEKLTHVRVTGTINAKDIKYLHYLAWSVPAKSTGMADDAYLRMVMRTEKEDTFRVKLKYLDLEDAHMVNDALPDKAFSGSYIIGYKLPKTLKKIGKNAFEWNVLLKELIIPESVDSIGSDLLLYSIKVEKVRLPDNLKILNSGMFTECWKLKEVNIPSQVREIYRGFPQLPCAPGFCRHPARDGGDIRRYPIFRQHVNPRDGCPQECEGVKKRVLSHDKIAQGENPIRQIDRDWTRCFCLVQ